MTANRVERVVIRKPRVSRCGTAVACQLSRHGAHIGGSALRAAVAMVTQLELINEVLFSFVERNQPRVLLQCCLARTRLLSSSTKTSASRHVGLRD